MTWRLPAEWEPQESVWLVWPRDPQTWPDRVEKARAVFVEAMRHVTRHERVDLVVHPDLEDDARAALRQGGVDEAPSRDAPRGVRLHAVEHVDSWVRDYGPLYLLDDAGRRRAVKCRFDAWGGKYESLMADDAVVGRLVDAGALTDPLTTLDTVLEGGAIDTDGQGTFLCTESVVRARGQEPADIERVLHDHLGARKVLWLAGPGVSGDDTDGHVDTIARFVAPRVVVMTVTPDMEHPDHRGLLADRERLAAMEDALSRSLHVQDLPLPDPDPPLTTDDGRPLPASHANFLVTDGCVLVPTYGGPSDAVALDILRAVFPDRQAVPLDHRDLIWGMGGIHCLSMQVPAAQPPGPATSRGE